MDVAEASDPSDEEGAAWWKEMFAIEAEQAARVARVKAAGQAGPPVRRRKAPQPTRPTAMHAARDAGTARWPAANATVDLNSIQHLMTSLSSPTLPRDPYGQVRRACKRCPTGDCPQYQPAGDAAHAGVAGDIHSTQQQQAQQPWIERPSQAWPNLSPFCAACGCHCAHHETPAEALDREEQERAAAERERQKRAQQELAAARRAQRAARQAAEAELAAKKARTERVEAACQRQHDADASGDFLETSHCDGLSQTRRGRCLACPACQQFVILFRACDANDPNVMLFCSGCGCPADAHVVDQAWKQREEAKRWQEQAAAAQRAQRAQHALHQDGAAQRKEAEAFRALGVRPSASAREVRQAYLQLALKCHPDKAAKRANKASGAGKSMMKGDEVAFHRITRAYELLSKQV
ncbi:hypothetical protein WJX72_000340 [[Myrmecia] bisecta]|uniref:J domain-containing protein n=1 Tax=[Myrmecia] bisecta TaxID=41462 RepID=A0AAW1PJ46_9CHLO